MLYMTKINLFMSFILKVKRSRFFLIKRIPSQMLTNSSVSTASYFGNWSKLILNLLPNQKLSPQLLILHDLDEKSLGSFSKDTIAATGWQYSTSPSPQGGRAYSWKHGQRNRSTNCIPGRSILIYAGLGKRSPRNK